MSVVNMSAHFICVIVQEMNQWERYLVLYIYLSIYILVVIIMCATGAILCMRPATEKWRYIVTSSLIDWAHTQNDPWYNLA